MKRYIYIIIGIIVVAVAAILILLFIKNRSANDNSTISITNGTLPAVGNQTSGTQTPGLGAGVISLLSPSSTSNMNGQGSITNFGVLSNDPVLDYSVDANNNITAIEPSGQIIAITNGNTSILNSSTINDIIEASFSYDGKKLLVGSGSQTDPQTSVFDLATDSWTTLPSGMQSPQWSTTGYQIAYLSTTGNGEFALSMINAANLKSGVATLLTLHATDMDLQWPTKNQFIISDKPAADALGSAWLFNASNGSLTPVAYQVNGLEDLWSHTTSTLGLIFSVDQNGQNPQLVLEDPSGATPNKEFSILTLPSKCSFNPEVAATSTINTSSSAYIALYCGVPRTTSNFSSANLPDSYNMMSTFTSDDIDRINTSNGEIDSLWSDSTQNVDVSNLKIFNNTLFFINRYDQKLYGLIFS